MNVFVHRRIDADHSTEHDCGQRTGNRAAYRIDGRWCEYSEVSIVFIISLHSTLTCALRLMNNPTRRHH